MNIADEKKLYFNILAGGEYPDFIDAYLDTRTLSRLSEIGLFCGVDYNQIPMFEMRYFYSRLDHSIACACLTWHFTKDKKQTIAALLHDVGTPVFSHCVDFMLNDTTHQESSEKTIYEMIAKDNGVLKLLAKDGVAVSDVCYLKKYPVLENKSPKMCVDRLESILSGGLVWHRRLDLETIAKIVSGVEILVNEEQELEIGFVKESSAMAFFKANMQQAIALQMNEDKLSMNYLGDMLAYMIRRQYITFDDLFTLTETDIINLIASVDDWKLMAQWYHFTNMQDINRHQESVDYCYQISIPVKKRYTNPLYGDERITDKIPEAQALLDAYLDYQDTGYASIEVPRTIFRLPIKARSLEQTSLK